MSEKQLSEKPRRVLCSCGFGGFAALEAHHLSCEYREIAGLEAEIVVLKAKLDAREREAVRLMDAIEAIRTAAAQEEQK